MKSIITWTITNALFSACLYFWLVEGIEGARNVACFFIGLSFFITLMITIKMEDAVRSAKTKSLVPNWLDQLFDLIVMGVLVWHGFFVLSALYLYHMVILCYYKDKVRIKFESQEK